MDQNFLDTLNIMSFYIGLLNYQENLTQSDKDDLIHSVTNVNKTLLDRLENDLEDQNKMLREIIERLDKLEKIQNGGKTYETQ